MITEAPVFMGAAGRGRDGHTGSVKNGHEQGIGMKRTGVKEWRWALPLAFCALTALAAGEAELEKGRAAFREGRHAEALQYFRSAAGQGNARAAYNAGVLYLNGNGVAADKTEAFVWFRKAADGGDGEAQFNLGLAAEQGDGVARDARAALAWYEKSARGGNVRAAARLILVSSPALPAYTPPAPLPASFDEAFYKGLSASQRGDHAEAFRWWQYSARMGHDISAMKNLGLLYYQGLGVKQSHVEARRWWAEAALQGENAEAMYFLGVMNNFGEGGARDLPLARLWYGAAQQKGYHKAAAALSAVAVDEQLAEGLAQYKAGDFAGARALFEKVAASGRSEAMMYLGLMASVGAGLPASDEQALQWYRKAADAGDLEGMIAVARFYFDGRGVPRDDAEAVNWLRRAQAETTEPRQRESLENQIALIQNAGRSEMFKATERSAQSGNDAAMYRLSQYYQQGQEGAPKDMERAVQWMEGAANAGNRDAMYAIRRLYETDGPYKDKKRARYWEEQSGKANAAETARKRAELDAYLADSARKNHEYRMKNDTAYRAQVEYQKNSGGSGGSAPGAFQDAMWQQNSWNNSGRNLGGGMYSSHRTSSTGDRIIEIKFR